jgi:hypothetical protein
VITGYNTDIKHNDRVFHVQTEDKGIDNPTIESLIYFGGKIIASREYSYGKLLGEGYSEAMVQELVDSQHRKMVRDIRGGKYDPEGPPAFGAGIISDRSFDEIVLEFITGLADQDSIHLVMKERPALKAGDITVLDLIVRRELRNAPVAGAEVVVTIRSQDGRMVSLFEGSSGEDGGVSAGVEIPAEAAGSEIHVVASSPVGKDELALRVEP